eukprot:TRINITY_DN13287_c0_g1_i1.p1 TRINITY_DN13287_c0_g1~~TRINITY_DN13287_c0_g1_i1.p1  ORF type:complete len:287 (+),score=86.16 TRINITY_DN13287_c0_g1_i1:184-1044(+)
MHRRKAEELKGPEGQDEEEGDAFFASKEKAEAAASTLKSGWSSGGGSAPLNGDKRPIWGAWSGPALIVVVLILCLTVWSLPAPTLLSKLDLLRQCWRINSVMDESERLREAIATAVKEKSDGQEALTKEEGRAVDLQRRLDSSGGDTKSLRAQLADEQSKSELLHSSNKDLEAQIDKERARRREVLHKLQEVKHAELKELARLDKSSPEDAPGAAAAASPVGISPLGSFTGLGGALGGSSAVHTGHGFSLEGLSSKFAAWTTKRPTASHTAAVSPPPYLTDFDDDG